MQLFPAHLYTDSSISPLVGSLFQVIAVALRSSLLYSHSVAAKPGIRGVYEKNSGRNQAMKRHSSSRGAPSPLVQSQASVAGHGKGRGWLREVCASTMRQIERGDSSFDSRAMDPCVLQGWAIGKAYMAGEKIEWIAGRRGQEVVGKSVHPAIATERGCGLWE